MTDLDQLLENAASDVQKGVHPETTPQSSSIARRASQKTAILGTMLVVIVALATLGIFSILQPGEDVVGPDDDVLITSEMILEDGVVTEEEYRDGALAVGACLTNAGFETRVDFDDTNGHAGFSSETQPNYDQEHFYECLDLHLSQNISLGWAVALGQIDLEELRQEETALTACVQESTGEDFGDLVYDEFGFLTEQGERTRDSAFEYQDHQPWGLCRNDLGYEEKHQAETRAVFECVERQTGEDFGDLTFDATGQVDELSQQALRRAITYQDDQAWEECRAELDYHD